MQIQTCAYIVLLKDTQKWEHIVHAVLYLAFSPLNNTSHQFFSISGPRTAPFFSRPCCEVLFHEMGALCILTFPLLVVSSLLLTTKSQ